MSEKNDKTPDEISDEDYKVAPTSKDQEILSKQQARDKKDQVTGENYQMPNEKKIEQELDE